MPQESEYCQTIRFVEFDPFEERLLRVNEARNLLIAEAIQLENVVRRAHQRPFTLHLVESAQQELPEAAGLFDLANDRFDDPFPGGIDGGPGLRVQLAGHPLDDRGRLFGKRAVRG